MKSGENEPSKSAVRFTRGLLLVAEIGFGVAALVLIALAARDAVNGQVAASIVVFFAVAVCALTAYRSAFGLRKLRQR
jgi:membrane protein implicated in regulation of membrane protease activity